MRAIPQPPPESAATLREKYRRLEERNRQLSEALRRVAAKATHGMTPLAGSLDDIRATALKALEEDAT
jgi:hypothetical protein